MRYSIDKLQQIPDHIGIYIFRSADETVLYVGKSIHLGHRVRSYFQQSGDQRAMIPQLTAQTTSIEILTLPTEADALATESNYIKKFQPKYNALLKDDKTYVSLKLNLTTKWPFLEVIRLKTSPKKSLDKFFGPYPNLSHARRLVKFLNAHFKLRQCSETEFSNRKRPCLLYQLNQCSAPCTGLIDSKTYNNYVRDLTDVLLGQQAVLIQKLKQRRDDLSSNLEFERAQVMHEYISDLKKIPQHQISHTLNQENLIVCALYEKNSSYSLCILTYKQGKLTNQQYQYFPNCPTQPPQLLEQLLYDLSSPLPKSYHFLVNLPDSLIEISHSLPTIRISSPKIGPKLKLIQTALENARLYYLHQVYHHENQNVLEDVMQMFALNTIPYKIDCFDVSNFSGDHMVAVCVHFKSGVKETSGYRKFTLKNISAGDDCKGIYQAVYRRYKEMSPEKLPDLILIDGSIAQVKAAQKALQQLSIIGVQVLGLSKEKAKHDKGIRKEKVILTSHKTVIPNPTSKELFFLQNIRDEAHRYAISFMKKKQSKQLTKHPLDSVYGIGPKKKKGLMQIFGSWMRLVEEFKDKKYFCTFLSEKDVENIEKEIERQKKNLKS